MAISTSYLIPARRGGTAHVAGVVNVANPRRTASKSTHHNKEQLTFIGDVPVKLVPLEKVTQSNTDI